LRDKIPLYSLQGGGENKNYHLGWRVENEGGARKKLKEKEGDKATYGVWKEKIMKKKKSVRPRINEAEKRGKRQKGGVCAVIYDERGRTSYVGVD